MQRAVAAILYEVEPVDGPLRVVVQSELLANEPGSPMPTADPRAAAVLESPLKSGGLLRPRRGRRAPSFDERSELRMGAALDHSSTAPREPT